MAQSLAAKSPIDLLKHNGFSLSERDLLSDASLLDFSFYPRQGIRGRGAEQIIQAMGLPLPAAPNKVEDDDTGTVLRLSETEYWILGSISSDDMANNLAELDQKQPCYPVLCQDSHAWLVLKSDYKAETLAKLCGVDLRESVFPPGTIAQTVVAGISTTIAHHQIEQNTMLSSNEIQQQPVFSLFCDRSVAHYLCDVIQDAMKAFS